MPLIRSFILATAGAVAIAPAVAEAETAADESARSTPQVAITFSPLHLVLPMVEVAGEFRLADQISAAAIAGAGSFSGNRLGDPADDNQYTAWEIGGQFRYYLLGDFARGLQLGAEVIYLDVAAEGALGSAEGEGLSAGAFGGYKHTFSFGLTLDGQLGAQAILVRAQNGEARASDEIVSVLLNLNAGWSF